MRLHLIRKYKPEETIGRLLFTSKLLCFVREAPKECFKRDRSCIPEGLYTLMPFHSEKRGWMISLGPKGLVYPLSADSHPSDNHLIPFTCFSTEKEPKFSRLAFSHLFEKLEVEWANDTVVELMISGIPVPYRLQSCRNRSRS
jgi:hypothetical protein